MKVLIIGGTKFLGRHLIAAALRNNHEITLFNRGKHSKEDFKDVEQIHGDRNADLEKITNRSWDVCIDTCGYLPQSVKASAEFLRESVNQYIFVSSISVYASFRRTNFDETAPLAELTAEQREKFEKIDPKGELNAVVIGEMYGALKALCECEAETAMPNRVLIVRSGLIVGEFDWTDRFSYWIMRTARGGEILAPGSPNRFVQFIDGQDLARWIIKMAEENQNGIFNVTGKPFDLTFGAFLERIKSVTASNAEFTWIDEDFLKKESVEAWSELPLYLHESDIDWQGFLSANIDKAKAKGLNFRPVEETIRETLKWRKTIKDELKAGISAEKETGLFEKMAQTAMKKILIIGSGGAGKSTMARRLGGATGIEVIHLDKHYWKPNWTEPPKDEWRKTVENAVQKESWIMDGNFGGTMEARLKACDTVIFLDFPRTVCVYRVFKRWLKYRNTHRPDMTEGCNEKIDLEFFGWIWNFPKTAKPEIEERLNRFGRGKTIFHLKSKREVEEFFAKLEAKEI